MTRAIAKLKAILAEDPNHFDAQLSLGMAYYRKGDYATAIAEGHKAEKLKPNEQLVHTNLSLFYMKARRQKDGGASRLQARIASWKADKTQPGENTRGRSRNWKWQNRRPGHQAAREISRHAVEKETRADLQASTIH